MTYYVYSQRPEKRIKTRHKDRVPPWKQDRAINPDTGKPFRDRRSKIKGGRVICKGADMKDLRERVGIREAEICQGHNCDAWAPMYPQDGQPAGEMHHVYGRGMGGGKRNDIASEMQWLCHGCHPKTKIKKRVSADCGEREKQSA